MVKRGKLHLDERTLMEAGILKSGDELIEINSSRDSSRSHPGDYSSHSNRNNFNFEKELEEMGYDKDEI